MIIAITSQGKNLSDQVDERFGRARYLILFNTETQESRVLDNSANVDAPSGAGTQAADFVATHGAEVLLTGNVGPKASVALRAARIKPFSVFHMTVKEAIARFQNGELSEIS